MGKYETIGRKKQKWKRMVSVSGFRMSVLEWGHRRKLVEERDKSREVCTRGCDEMGDDDPRKKKYLHVSKLWR